MTRELKKHLRAKGAEMTPAFNSIHIEKALLLTAALFVISLTMGIFIKSIGLLCESLLLICLSWGIYRTNFSAILLLSVYLLVSKTYQLIFLTEVPWMVRILSVLLSLLLSRYFYLGFKAPATEQNDMKLFGLLDIFFLLTISLVSISVSGFAIEWYK